MTIFEWTFKPPVIGSQHIPIKITGSGRCELRSDGLQIQGFRQTPKISSSQVFILFFSLFFGLVFIKVSLQAYAKITIPDQWIAIITFMVGISPFILGLGTDHQGEFIQLLIPWKNISKAKLDKKSICVLILVEKFRYQGECYQGALYFEPSNGVDTLLMALHAQRVK